MADPMTELATRLPCSFGVLTELSSAEIEDIELDRSQKLCITSNLDQASYVYVVQLERDPATEKVTTVWVLYPDDPAADRLRAGDNVRIPEVGAWLQTVEKGQVRALTAARSLTAADLRDLVGGREPLAGTVTVKNARTGAGWP